MSTSFSAGLLLVCILSASAAAQLCFEERVISSSPDRLGVSAIADMDGDGDLDIIAATSNSIHWYENDGSGAFADLPVEIMTAGTGNFVGLSSFNIVRLLVAEVGDGAPGSVVIFAINKPTTAAAYDLLWCVKNGTNLIKSVFLNSASPTGITPENVFFINVDGNNTIDLLTNGSILVDDNGTGKARWYKFMTAWGGIESRFLALPGFPDPADPAVIVAIEDMDRETFGAQNRTFDDFVLSNGQWYSNDAMTFTLQLDVHPSASGNLRPVDINGDGEMDLLSESGLWFRNDGQIPPAFTVQTVTNEPNAGYLIPADLDNDGDLDLVGEGGFWFENLGGSPLTFWKYFLPALSEPEAVNAPFTLVDMDGDGDIDIVAQDGSGWYRNSLDVQGVFEFATVGLINPDSVPGFALGDMGDLDGDGDLDSVAASADTSVLSWHKNLDGINGTTGNRSGSLAELVFNAVAGETLTVDSGIFECLPLTGLVMQKGLVVSSRGRIQTDVDLVLGNGDALNAAIGSGVTLFGVTQIRGDALLQGSTVTAASHVIFAEPDSLLNVSGDLVLHGTPRLTSVTSNERNTIFGIRSADIDGDGFDDLVISGNDNTANPGWIRNNSGQWPDGTKNPNSQRLADSLQAGSLDGFDLGDINGDGLIDLVGVRGNSLDLYLNDAGVIGNGMLSDPAAIDGLVELNGPVAVGDIDGDGKPDVVHTGGGLDLTDPKISWYRNIDGTPGGFVRNDVGTATGLGAYWIDLVDMDLDGDLDVLVGSQSNNGLDAIVWHETSVTIDGKNPPVVSFSLRQIASTARFAYQVIGADMDGDGDIDVVSGFGPGNKIAWFENTGAMPPVFGTERMIDPLGTGNKSLVVVDLDNDGDLDILSGNRVMYLNDGQQPPSFRKRRDFQSEAGVVAAFDFDNDRVVDFVGTDPKRDVDQKSPVHFFTNSLDVVVDMIASGSVLNSTGDILANTAQIKLGPDSDIIAGGKLVIAPEARISGDGVITTGLGVENMGEILISPDRIMLIQGDYSQVSSDETNPVSGTLGIYISRENQSAPLFVTGVASLGGGLRIEGFAPAVASLDERYPVIFPLQGIDPLRSEFDVISAPIIDVLDGKGETVTGTLVQGSSKGTVNGLVTVDFEPITLSQLVFTPGEFEGFVDPNDAVLADVTGDGTPDLVVAVPAMNAVALLIGEVNSGDGSFAFSDMILYQGGLADAPVAVEVGDFNGDGTMEIAFANRGDSGGDNDIHFLQYNGTGLVPAVPALVSIVIPDGGVVTDMAVGNLENTGTGDNPDDLAVGIQGSDGSGSSMTVFGYNNIDWESCTVDVDDIDSVDVFPGTPALAGLASMFDNLVYTSPESDTATILLLDQTTGLVDATHVGIPTGVRPTEVQAADLNGDTLAEIVIICEGNNSTNGVLTVVRALPGSTSYASPVNLPLTTDPMVSPNPVSLALVNLNDDGDLDIAVVSTNEGGNQVVRAIRNTTVGSGNGLSFTAVADAPDQPTGIPVILRSSNLDGSGGGSPIADDIVILTNSASPLGMNGVAGKSKILGITPTPPCPVDLNGDGIINFVDVSAFVSAFSIQDSSADFNGDGIINFVDVSAFVSAFSVGCP